MNAMLKQFNLPNYIDGLSFADASKKIQAKFKERTDPESKSFLFNQLLIIQNERTHEL